VHRADRSIHTGNVRITRESFTDLSTTKSARGSVGAKSGESKYRRGEKAPGWKKVNSTRRPRTRARAQTARSARDSSTRIRCGYRGRGFPQGPRRRQAAPLSNYPGRCEDRKTPALAPTAQGMRCRRDGAEARGNAAPALPSRARASPARFHRSEPTASFASSPREGTRRSRPVVTGHHRPLEPPQQAVSGRPPLTDLAPQSRAGDQSNTPVSSPQSPAYIIISGECGRSASSSGSHIPSAPRRDRPE